MIHNNLLNLPVDMGFEIEMFAPAELVCKITRNQYCVPWEHANYQTILDGFILYPNDLDHIEILHQKWLAKQKRFNRLSFDSWLQEHGVKNLVEEMKLVPVNMVDSTGIYLKNTETRAQIFSNLKNQLLEKFNYSIECFDSYHICEKNYTNKWYIEPDQSIIGPSGSVALELTSPTFQAGQALDNLNHVLDSLIGWGYKVNNTCGLHINLSHKTHKVFDPIKFCVLVDENNVLKTFNRQNSRECVPQLPKVWTEFVKTKQCSSQFMNWSTKNHFINLHGLRTRGWLEVRGIGGASYFNKKSHVIDTTKKIIQSFDASHSKAKDKIYIKKSIVQFEKWYNQTTSSGK